MKPTISVKDTMKEYVMGEAEIRATGRVSFEVNRRELVIVLGPSGAGRSTVLDILGGMDFPTLGKIWVNGKDVSELNRDELTMYRRKHVDFVFQFYNLMPNLIALENVETAAQICNGPTNSATVLAEVGLRRGMAGFPTQLSGGEQQRVPTIKAVAKNPTLLLYDEPAGALDYMTGKSILKLLQHVNCEFKKTMMIITYSNALVPMTDKVVKTRNEKVEAVERNEAPVPVEKIE